MRPRPGRCQRWLFVFLGALLDADDDTLALLQSDPFDGEPSEQVRVLRYRYRYTTPDEHSETGDWWRRERVDTYVGAVARAELARRRQRAGRVRL